MARRTCLVTGATGFIGSHLARRLVNDGWDVHVLLRDAGRLREIPDLAASVRSHTTDGTASSVASIISAASPAVVFHLAATFRAEHQPGDVDVLIDSNVKLTAQLLDAMAQMGVRRLINASTNWQHYGSAGYDPASLYAATKQAAEDIITFYCNARGMHAVSLVLPDTYGPGDKRKKLLHALALATQSTDPVDFSPGEQLLDLIHIDDVVDAFMVAASRPDIEKHERFSITSGAPLSLRAVAELFSEVTGRTANIRWGGRTYRHREMMVPGTTAQLLPGWQSQVSLRAGLATLLGQHAA